LQDEDSWALVSDENKRKLYAMLPPVSGGKESDYKIHPLSHPKYGPHLKAYIAHVEGHLESGANKAWEKEAKQASALRAGTGKPHVAKQPEKQCDDQAREGAKDKDEVDKADSADDEAQTSSEVEDKAASVNK